MEQNILTARPSFRNHLFALIIGVATMAMGIGFPFLLWVIYKKYSAKYIVTAEKCICQIGFISRNQTEVYIEDIRGISSKQTIIQRILGIGDVVIGSAATAGAEIIFKGIAAPQKAVDKINALRKKSH